VRNGLLAHAARRMRARLAWGLCMMLAAQAAQTAQAAPAATPVSVTDDRGVTVQLSAPPQRIVSLLPSLTETVCELGACARLVGVDRYANHPTSVRQLPNLGGLDDINVEALVAARPDVVLLSLSARVIERLEGLGLKVIALEPKSFDDVHHVAVKVGQLLGQPEAGERLWQRMSAQLAAAARTVPPQARGWRVYYEVDSAPYAAGSASFIGHLLQQMGLRNIVGPDLGPFPKLNPEYVVRADPQLIMLSERSAAGLSGRPGWARIRALQDGHVCAFTPAQRDVLSRPGPRLGEGAQFMAACVRDLALKPRGHKP
jgi:iron complex transport system substrate-binding protein